MSGGRNPFADLIPEQDMEDKETAKWRRKGEIASSKVHGLINPNEGQMQPKVAINPQENAQESNPFMDLLPKKPEMIDTFIGKVPSSLAKAPFVSKESIVNPETVEGLINGFSGAPGLKAVGQGTVNLGKVAGNLFKKVAPKELAYGIQRAHDKLLGQSSDIYNFIKSEVGPRGVKIINIGKDLIDEAKSHLPKTRASQKLIEKASTGDYEALHQLQSDLGKRGTKSLGANLAADRNVGEEMLDTREKINEAIRNQFKENGHEDLAKLLDEATGKYKKLKDIYYSHPKVAKLVHSESRLVPEDPLKLFSEESVPMKKLLGEHKEIEPMLKIAKEKEEAINLLKKAGIGGGAVGGLEYLGSPLIKKIFGGNE